MSEIVQMSVLEWRRKAREGALTVEEMRVALEAMRAERKNAGSVSAASKATKRTAAAKAAPIDSDALLGDLMK